MPLEINLSNQTIQSLIQRGLNDKVNITSTDLPREVVSVSLRTDKTTEVFESSPTVNLTQRQTVTLIQLQELQDSTTLQIQPQKKDEIDLNGVPRLSWLIGRNNDLHLSYLNGLSRGATLMKEFSEIVERNKNNTVISKEDWQTIERSIKGFEIGLANRQKYRTETHDPIVHKVIDYIMPKTQQRLDLLKQFLASKEKPFETEALKIETFKLKTSDIKTDTNPQQLVSSNRETTELLDFLAKDLRWYKWYLEDEKENLTSIYSLKYFDVQSSITYIFNI